MSDETDVPTGRAELRARGDRWRQQTRRALEPLTHPVAGRGGDLGPAERVSIDYWTVHRARECPALVTRAEDYVTSVGNARRRVGLAVAAQVRADPSMPPVEAAWEVVADRDQALPFLTDWVEEIGPGGQAALIAEAATWASRLLALIGLGRLKKVRFASPDGNPSWYLPGTPVRVRGRWEAATPFRAIHPNRRLLVTGRTDGGEARARAAHEALADTLCQAAPPASVRVADLARGTSELVDVDDELLGEGLEGMTGALHAAVRARYGPPAEATPGPWCRGCVRSVVGSHSDSDQAAGSRVTGASDDGRNDRAPGVDDPCEPGIDWRATHRPRIGGLPVLGP